MTTDPDIRSERTSSPHTRPTSNDDGARCVTTTAMDALLLTGHFGLSRVTTCHMRDTGSSAIVTIEDIDFRGMRRTVASY